MSEGDNATAFVELLGEIKLLRADLEWIKRSGDNNAEVIQLMDNRLRHVEATQATFVGAQKTPISWPVIASLIVAAVVAAAALLDRVYVSQ